MGVREFINCRPMLGWAVAAVLGLAGVWVVILNTRGDETDRLTQVVTIRDAETGETWKLPRGAMEKELMLRPYPVDPTKGLVNPKTGKATGYPADDWEVTVERINAMRDEAQKRRGR